MLRGLGTWDTESSGPGTTPLWVRCWGDLAHVDCCRWFFLSSDTLHLTSWMLTKFTELGVIFYVLGVT